MSYVHVVLSMPAVLKVLVYLIFLSLVSYHVTPTDLISALSTKLYPIRTCEGFCSSGTFSSVNLLVTPYVDDGHYLFVHLNEIFKENEVHCLNMSRLDASLEYTEQNNALQVNNEYAVTEKLLKELFVPLFGTVLSSRCYAIPGVKCCPLGIGSTKTWHGTPDLRVDSVNVTVTKEVDDETEDGNEEFEKECFDDIEGKPNLLESHLNQLLATNIVSSFIHHSTSDKSVPMTPSILIDGSHGTKFRVSFYDCVNDVLLLSRPVTLVKENGELFSKESLILLFLVVHYE